MIKIVLTDDHPLILEGIGRLIDARDHMQVIAQYATGEALLEGLKEQTLPDILMLDITLPDTTGNDLIRLLHKQYPQLKVIVLTSMDANFQIKDMMKQGCKGYLLKTAAPNIIIEAIEAVYRGEEYLNPGLKEQLLNTALYGSPKLKKTLSKRELDILTAICNGETNEMIAQKLSLSLRTIENYRFAMYKKFDVNNTASLVKVALQQGLLED